MAEAYKTVYLGGEGEIVEKKSRFIAVLEHVETEEEAVAFIEGVKKKHWSARHNCYAYILGTVNPTMRCSDDGEPAQTAGRPMLDVLLGAGLCNTVVVVTRYFGGTLLGTGGLVRAYSQAVKAGIEESVIISRQPGIRMEVLCDYTWSGKIQYLAASMELTTLDTEYSDRVLFTLLVPEDSVAAFHKKIQEATNAQAQVTELEALYYAEAEGTVLLFDH